MSTSARPADERAVQVSFSEDEMSVRLMDGRTITVPLAWYPRLLNATSEQRNKWKIAGGGYGLHWPDLDEDLSTEGLLRGAPARSLTRNRRQDVIRIKSAVVSRSSKAKQSKTRESD